MDVSVKTPGREDGSYAPGTPLLPCCADLMAILLVIGVMDVRAMAVVAAAFTVERLAQAGERVVRAMGAVIVGAALFLMTRAAGPG